MSGPAGILDDNPLRWQGSRSLTKLTGQLVVQRRSKRFRRSVDAKKDKAVKSATPSCLGGRFLNTREVPRQWSIALFQQGA